LTRTATSAARASSPAVGDDEESAGEVAPPLAAAAALAVPAAIAARLAALELLAPGDFAVVKRQAALLDELPAPDEFVEQLEREHRAKPDVRFSKPLGFVR
jgi:hypothetical protein